MFKDVYAFFPDSRRRSCCFEGCGGNWMPAEVIDFVLDKFIMLPLVKIFVLDSHIGCNL